jgi:hypothetical protein
LTRSYDGGVIRRLLLVVVIAAAGGAGAYLWLEGRATVGDLPPIRQEDPDPGSPPIVWVSGTLTELRPTTLEIREGDGPTVEVQRFAEGATRFFQPAAGDWRRVPEDRVDDIPEGRRVCVEALLDGQRLLGLRVFLETRCAPVP